MTGSDCLDNVELSKEKGIGFSDAIACVVMGRLGISEIYSFDSNFDRVIDSKGNGLIPWQAHMIL